MSSPHLGPRGLDDLRRQLDARALAIVRQVADLRLMSTRQIEAVYYPPTSAVSASAAARACRRLLARLTCERVLVRLERRLGGVHGGSSSWIYALGPVGYRIIDGDRSRPRFREPSALFVDHTLAISQLVTDLAVIARSGRVEILKLEPEPRCWRELGGGRRDWLKPDLHVVLGCGDLEHSWFVEIDRSTAHVPALRRKCQLYERYYQSGREQHAHGVFPKVCWIVLDRERAERMEDLLHADRDLTEDLFCVVTAGNELDVLTRGSS